MVEGKGGKSLETARAQIFVKQAQHTHLGNQVGARSRWQRQGARRGLPPAASPGRRGAGRIRPVLNFTAP